MSFKESGFGLVFVAEVGQPRNGVLPLRMSHPTDIPVINVVFLRMGPNEPDRSGITGQSVPAIKRKPARRMPEMSPDGIVAMIDDGIRVAAHRETHHMGTIGLRRDIGMPRDLG